MVCDMLHRLALIHNRAHRHPLIYIIINYNRAAVLAYTASCVAVVSGIGEGAALEGMPSNVAQSVYSLLVWLLHCVRWNG